MIEKNEIKHFIGNNLNVVFLILVAKENPYTFEYTVDEFDRVGLKLDFILYFYNNI